MLIMKDHLKKIFQKKIKINHCRIKFQSNQHDQIYRKWQKSIENDEKIIFNKDITIYREIFERTFPELRKIREKKQLNMNETFISEQQLPLNTNVIEQELEIEENKMRQSSIIPPMIYNSWQRKYPYLNQNNFIQSDATNFYKQMPDWSSKEKQIFIEKFTQSPKNFAYISSFLENKTTEQCIQFYYMTKKTKNYKYLLRKQVQVNRRKTKQNASMATHIESRLVNKVNSILSSTSQQIHSQTTMIREQVS